MTYRRRRWKRRRWRKKEKNMKKNSLLTAFLALLILAGIFALVVGFGMKVDSSDKNETESDSQMSVTTAPSGGSDSPSSGKQLVLSSEDAIDWKVKEVTLDGGYVTDLYYVSASLETGKQYKWEVFVNYIGLAEIGRTDVSVGLGLFEDQYNYYWADDWTYDSQGPVFEVYQDSNTMKVICYFELAATDSGVATIDFYTHGSPDEVSLESIDPSVGAWTSFNLYCID